MTSGCCRICCTSGSSIIVTTMVGRPRSSTRTSQSASTGSDPALVGDLLDRLAEVRVVRLDARDPDLVPAAGPGQVLPAGDAVREVLLDPVALGRDGQPFEEQVAPALLRPGRQERRHAGTPRVVRVGVAGDLDAALAGLLQQPEQVAGPAVIRPGRPPSGGSAGPARRPARRSRSPRRGPGTAWRSRPGRASSTAGRCRAAPRRGRPARRSGSRSRASRSARTRGRRRRPPATPPRGAASSSARRRWAGGSGTRRRRPAARRARRAARCC